MRQISAAKEVGTRTRWRAALALTALGASLNGCSLYNQFIQRGGSLPLGESGAEWSPAVSTPTGGAIGVQIMHRF